MGVGGGELRNLFRMAHGTIYPRRQPLGLISLEPRACSCPVTAVEEGALPAAIVPRETGWLSARNAEAAVFLDRPDKPEPCEMMFAECRHRTQGSRWPQRGNDLDALLRFQVRPHGEAR